MSSNGPAELLGSDQGFERQLGLTPACTIAAYRALRQRSGADRSLADLLVLIAEDPSLAPELPAEAAAAVAADLEYFSEFSAHSTGETVTSCAAPCSNAPATPCSTH